MYCKNKWPLITSQYHWPNILKDIEISVKHCHAYQINKKCKQKRFEIFATDDPKRETV